MRNKCKRCFEMGNYICSDCFNCDCLQECRDRMYGDVIKKVEGVE